jgi:lipopolysaccharide export system permease protein
MKRLLDRYVYQEIIPPFLGGVFLFSFILVMDKVLKLTDLVLLKGVDPKTMGRLLAYLFPPLISFTIPMAILFASLMAFGRLASDNEIIAIRCSGFHPIRIILPGLIFGLLAVLICFWLEASIIPSVNQAFRDIIFSFQKQKAFLALNEKGFQEFGDEMVAYVQEAKKGEGKERGYEGILITDYTKHGASRVIFAHKGKMSIDQSNDNILLSLIDGSIHPLELEKKKIYQMITFGRYDTAIEMSGYTPVRGKKKRYKELSFQDILSMLKSTSISFQEEVGLKLEWHRRFAFPFACFVFAFIGSLIGMESQWSGKCSSFAVCIIVIIIYYFLLTAGTRLSMAGYLWPGISAWLPNIIYLGLGVALFREAF